MKTVIEMAQEAGFTQGIEELTAEEFAVAGVWVQDTEITELVERLVELVRADEREACAKVCEETNERFAIPFEAVSRAAAAIRARGNT